MEGIYEIVEAGVEGLEDWGVQKESVDTVVTVLCLCSVGEPRRMIGNLYGFLRRGGRWVFLEHVVTQRGGFIKWYQGELDDDDEVDERMLIDNSE